MVKNLWAKECMLNSPEDHHEDVLVLGLMGHQDLIIQIVVVTDLLVD